MTEHSFCEVMKQWKRWCESHNGGIYDVNMKGRECNPFQYAMENAKEIETLVMNWAKMNPEPIYPTWGEWLNSITHQTVDRDLLDSQIPANIAPLIGVKPI